jgi:hypothetical protein
VVAFLFIIAGLGLASTVSDPTVKMLFLCVAGFGFFAVLPIFWTLPTAFLSGAGAAAGIAAVNSIGDPENSACLHCPQTGPSSRRSACTRLMAAQWGQTS